MVHPPVPRPGSGLLEVKPIPGLVGADISLLGVPCGQQRELEFDTEPGCDKR